MSKTAMSVRTEKVHMNAYERGEHEAIVKWEKCEPSVIAQATGFVFKPAGWLLEKIIPNKMIEAALVGFDKTADFLTDSGDVLRDGSVSKISDLRGKDLELSDEMANSVHNWAVGVAATEGGAAGAMGVAGMIVDIPAVVTMALRAVHKIGLCYGYEVSSPEERQFVLGILAAAGANTMKEKNAALAVLQKIAVYVAKTTWKKMASDKTILAAGILALKQLAKELGINLTKRKVAQIVPVVGGVVGATVNASFLNDVAWAARREYQKRWLMESRQM